MFHLSTKRRRKKHVPEAIFEEIMVKKFPELMKGTNPQIQKVQLIQSRANKNKFTSIHSTVKRQKSQHKRKTLKVVRVKKV